MESAAFVAGKFTKGLKEITANTILILMQKSHFNDIQF